MENKVEEPGAVSQVQFPSILKYTNKAAHARQITTAERKKEIEKQFKAEVPKKHEIVGMFAVMDKNLDVTSPYTQPSS